VGYAGTGAHVLDLPAGKGLLVPHAVPVGKLTVHHIGKYLHVLVGVGIKAGTRLDQIVVHYPQYAKIDIPGIKVFRERKMKMAVQPAVPAPAHVFVVYMFNHNNNIRIFHRKGKLTNPRTCYPGEAERTGYGYSQFNHHYTNRAYRALISVVISN
jgi:hypothetical protein